MKAPAQEQDVLPPEEFATVLKRVADGEALGVKLGSRLVLSVIAREVLLAQSVLESAAGSIDDYAKSHAAGAKTLGFAESEYARAVQNITADLAHGIRACKADILNEVVDWNQGKRE